MVELSHPQVIQVNQHWARRRCAAAAAAATLERMQEGSLPVELQWPWFGLGQSTRQPLAS